MRGRCSAVSASLAALAGVLVMLFAADAATASESDSLYFFDKHPEQIRHISTCGSWHHDGLHGFYRVIEAYEFAQSFLYVQWMTDYDFQRSATRVVATALFPEIDSERAEIILSEIQCSKLNAATQVTARANFAHEDKWYRMHIDLEQTPGKFKLEFVALKPAPERKP